jgi:hypothetical protein
MIGKRLLLTATVAGAFTLAVAGPAAAAPQPRAPWTCAGQVCLAVDPAGGITPMDNSGCNHQVCIYVTGDASNGYSSSGHGSGFYGHIHVWGPGGLDRNGDDANAPVASGSGRGRGQTCAEGWKQVTGGYTSVGLPCVQVN